VHIYGYRLRYMVTIYLGGTVMAETKKILISLSENLLNQVDVLASVDNKNRSELVRDAMKYYLKERRRIELREALKKGYLEMAELNLEMARQNLEVDNELIVKYEKCLGSWV